MDPSDAGYFFACLRRHGCFRGDTWDDVEFDSLFFDLKFKECIGKDKWRYIVSCLLVDLIINVVREGMRDDTSRMAQSTSGSSLLIFPRGNDQVEPFQPLTRIHYNNFSLASLWRREIPFPNSRQEGCLQELELVFYIS